MTIPSEVRQPYVDFSSRRLGAQGFRQFLFATRKRSTARHLRELTVCLLSLAPFVPVPAGAQGSGLNPLSGVLGGIAPHSIVAIQTANGNYLTAVNGGGLGGPITGIGAAAIRTDRMRAQGWEIFTVVQVNSEQFAFRTASGNYVTAVNGGGVGGPNDPTSPIHSDARSIRAWETFIITMINQTQATIQTCDGHYLTVNNGGGFGGPNIVPIHTDAKSIGGWEKFTFVSSTCPQNISH